MLDPYIPPEIEITVDAQVKKTEDKEKVARAVSNLFHSGGELRVEEKHVQFISDNIESLKFLKDQFRDRQIRAAAKRLLLSGGGSKETSLLLNKQAATAGIAALCDDPAESPLGPIVLTIRSGNLESAIEWITSGYSSPERS